MEDYTKLICPLCGDELNKKAKCYIWTHKFDAKLLFNRFDRQIVFKTSKTSQIDFLRFTYSTTTDKVMFGVGSKFVATKLYGPFSLDELSDISIKCNDEVLYKTSFNPMPMIAGGMLFGSVGAIAGSKISNTKIKAENKKIYFISISINSLECPGFSFYTSDENSTHQFMTIIRLLKKTFIKEELADNNEKTIEVNNIPNIIRKYKLLYDDGMISKEEFLKVKDKLLNI